MNPYRPDAEGIHVRRAGEPCEHPTVAVVRYADEGGPYWRCRSCGAGTDQPAPPAPEAVREMFHQLGFWPTKADPFAP